MADEIWLSPEEDEELDAAVARAAEIVAASDEDRKPVLDDEDRGPPRRPLVPPRVPPSPLKE